ncbi:TRAP transporter small permease subunit [Caminibacter pacificus]|uniref:TRAP transporter small permease subunit n=1 Tax=Caminibacter pacificus TaxID=1424653 RepID=A0AAJ4RE42_9BACT|nr:TRAP transporter small permease subunit [Caminibacter pacificus]NPA88260.1 TRAP transporter small permease subunit [Campylobacterota bacterium]QCI28358.1 TRAP transporter small permease subunit [Caminibacter pacificus]ROR40921.1 TRAP-type mannitol/chloroaromatic compound transport system permease small subunit [Caminibacter pacificus]
MDIINYLNDHLDLTILAAIVIAFVLSLIPKIDYPIEKLTNFFMIISVIALISLTLLVSYDVIARKLFHGGSIALQELEWHLFDIVFLFAIAYTLSKDKHVRVDIFYDKFPFKLKKTINLITILFFVIPLSVLIIVEAIPFVQMSYAQHESSGDPGGLCCRWIIKSAMIWAFAVVYLQSIAELRKIYYQLKHHKGE